jgi:hypothetical protein
MKQLTSPILLFCGMLALTAPTLITDYFFLPQNEASVTHRIVQGIGCILLVFWLVQSYRAISRDLLAERKLERALRFQKRKPSNTP